MITKILCSAGIFFLPFITTLSFGQEVLISEEKVNALMEHCHENRLFNGVVLMAKGDSVLYQESYGYAVMEWDIPHTIDTKFRIASCTKQFTSMLIMQLHEEGKLDLKIPISQYLPNFKNPIADSINIHQLLSHTSGAPRWESLAEENPEYWYSDVSIEDILEYFRNSTLEFKPGKRFKYGSIGYELLAAIIESVTHESYEEALYRRILKPVGMENSGMHNPYELKKKYAFAYENWDFAYNISDYYNPSHAIGATGIYSTAPDLLKWSQAITNNTLISDSMKRKMFTPVTYRHYEGYGYGWYIGFYEFEEKNQKINYQQHTGGMPGHTSLITRCPDEGYTIILLNNTGHSKLELINYELLKILKGYDWTMRKDLAVELSKCTTRSEIDQIKKDFYANEEGYFEAENQLCGLVYQTILNNKKDLAESIFEFGLELYPGSQRIIAYRNEANKRLLK